MSTTYHLTDIEEVAKSILKKSTSQVLLFYGEMGVGKTTLIKELCRQLGVEDTVSSPTFSIVNQYSGENDTVIYHFDCYRIENPNEVLDIGFEEYLDQGDWIFIEWPEKIDQYLPKDGLTLTIQHTFDDERKLEMNSIC